MKARLAKLIPMLGSTFDGEVVNTVRAIERVLKANDLTFHDLAGMLTKPGARPQPAPRPSPGPAAPSGWEWPTPETRPRHRPGGPAPDSGMHDGGQYINKIDVMRIGRVMLQHDSLSPRDVDFIQKMIQDASRSGLQNIWFTAKRAAYWNNLKAITGTDQ